jgi:hypothetical protein
MPGRSPHEVVLSDAERAELEHRAACYTRPHREVQRAKLVLLAAEGKTNVEIGECPRSRQTPQVCSSKFPRSGLEV